MIGPSCCSSFHFIFFTFGLDPKMDSKSKMNGLYGVVLLEIRTC